MTRRERARNPAPEHATRRSDAARPGGGGGLHPLLVPLLVGFVVAIGYTASLSYSFHFDDFSSIRDNATLTNPFDLARVWAFRPSRVVLGESFALNRFFVGAQPAGYRVVNLLIHLAASLLAGWIAREIAQRHEAARRAGSAPTRWA